MFSRWWTGTSCQTVILPKVCLIFTCLKYIVNERLFCCFEAKKNTVTPFKFKYSTLIKMLFSQGKYSSSPTIFATAEHHRSRLKHDATSVWLEDVSASSFKICLRELQNFAGVHDDISVVRVIKFYFSCIRDISALADKREYNLRKPSLLNMDGAKYGYVSKTKIANTNDKKENS